MSAARARVAAVAATLASSDRPFLAGLGLLSVCSWGRWLATGSLKVDENYPASSVAIVLLVLLAVGWALLVGSFAGLLAEAFDDARAQALSPARIRRLALAGLAVASLMLPMLSNDLFQLLSWSSLAAHGQDVFTSSRAFQASEWHSLVAARWVDTLCHYGPVSLVAAMPSVLAHGNPWIALLLVRVGWLVPLVLVMLLSFRVLPSQRAFHTMVWLNPLWLLEGPGQLHCDLVGFTLVSAGVVLGLRGRKVSAVLLYALAVVSKYTFVLTGPWFLLFDPGSARDRALRALAMASAVAMCGALFYAPFWLGIETLTAPIRDILAEKPGGTLLDVVGVLAGPSWIVAVVGIALKGVTAVLGARIAYVMLRRDRPEVTALGTGALIVLVATLGGPKFEPWYLLPALPFFGLSSTPAWRTWLTVGVGLSVLPTFANVLPAASPVLPVWGALTTGADVLWFFAMLRARYVGAFPATAGAGARG